VFEEDVMKTTGKFFFVFALVILGLQACSSSVPPPTIDVAAVQTYTAQTVVAAAVLTSQAASPTLPPSSTPTPVPPTDVPAPTPTLETPTQTPEPSATLAAFKVPTAVIGVLLERDDFEQTQFWYTETQENYSLAYDQGGYRIRNGLESGLIYSVRSLSLEDVLVEVDANDLQSPDGSYWGLVCRHQDNKRYYALVIGPDGFYGIGKMKNGIFQFIQKDAVADKTIYKADENGFVPLRGDCVGDTLTLFVNGKQLLQVKDDEYQTGDAGLVVGYGTDGAWVDILFDNFALWQPEP
jgi:hypothetical protein